jgi:hypothetical protein
MNKIIVHIFENIRRCMVCDEIRYCPPGCDICEQCIDAIDEQEYSECIEDGMPC